MDQPDRQAPAHRQEVTKIAQPRRRSSSSETLKDILATAEEHERAVREQALERALQMEAEELLATPGARAAGRVLQDIPYRGSMLRVKVPRVRTPDGSVGFPPMFDALVESAPGVLELLEAGVSTRDAAGIMAHLYGESGIRGTSSSSLSRKSVAAGKEQETRMKERRFNADPIVAVSLDGTGIGTRGKKRTVFVAIGITARGERLALGVTIAQGESEAEDSAEAALAKLEVVAANLDSMGFADAAKSLAGRDGRHRHRAATRPLPPAVAKRRDAPALGSEAAARAGGQELDPPRRPGRPGGPDE